MFWKSHKSDNNKTPSEYLSISTPHKTQVSRPLFIICFSIYNTSLTRFFAFFRVIPPCRAYLFIKVMRVLNVVQWNPEFMQYRPWNLNMHWTALDICTIAPIRINSLPCLVVISLSYLVLSTLPLSILIFPFLSFSILPYPILSYPIPEFAYSSRYNSRYNSQYRSQYSSCYYSIVFHYDGVMTY